MCSNLPDYDFLQLIFTREKNMVRFVRFAALAVVCFAGCTPEYVPPKEAIPEIPAGRSSGEAGGAPGTAPATKGANVGPSKMAKPK